MAMVTGAKRRRRLEEEEEDEEPEQIRRLKEEEEDEELLEDCISALPDVLLGDIVSLLPTRDGARTQVLSTRWRHIWRSAPLNVDLDPNYYAAFGAKRVPASVISGILSAHQGPGRRFSVPDRYTYLRDIQDAVLDCWLGSPALDGLQELGFHYSPRRRRNMEPLPLPPPPPLPALVHRFSSTLRAASFGRCTFPDDNSAGGFPIQLPLLRQLSLSDVRISESSLRGLLAAFPVLQSLLLSGCIGCSSIRIVSPTLRSIGVKPSYGAIILRLLIIEDAPCLDRLHCFSGCGKFTISVISAPQLRILGPISAGGSLRLELGTTVFQERRFVSLKMVTHSLKVLALTQEHLSLDAVIEFMNCFPCMEKLYIMTNMAGEKNVWCHKYRNPTGTLVIPLKKIVLAGYRGNTSHVNFAKFFVLNAQTLESMRLELLAANPSDEWIEKQHRLLQIKKKASRDMQLDFVDHLHLRYPLSHPRLCPEQVHDLSTADPFSWHV